MLQIQNTLVSLDILEKRFVCDLQKCKGACCVKGDAGAPLTQEELLLIETIYEKVKPFMHKEGTDAIEKKGKYTIDDEGEHVTTLADNVKNNASDGACAYAVFEKNGSTKCAFELAYNAGETDFKKPVSCHLYPVRIAKYNEFNAVNFHAWEICSPACECGKKLNIKVYQFLKEALIRKFGKHWFEELELADKMMQEKWMPGSFME